MNATSTRDRELWLEGNRVTVAVLRGYKLIQERPYPCGSWAPDPRTGRYSSGCKCGQCDGRTTYHQGYVERRIFWADNSIEAVVMCDDGERRTVQLVAPHGDVC